MRIAIYSRKSKETGIGDSINNQINMVKKYFGNNHTFEIFEDEGFSGKNTNRPSFKLMMKKVRNNKFDTVAVYRIDRISRCIADFVNLYEELKEYETNLVSVTECFDPNTPYGKLSMIMLAAFAEMERDNISSRMKDNKLENAQKGFWTGGRTPLGFKTIDTYSCGNRFKTLEMTEDSDLIIEIYNKYLYLGSMHKLGKWLYESKGIKLCRSTLRNIISSPYYCKYDESINDFFKNLGYTFIENDNKNSYIIYNRRSGNRRKKENNSIIIAPSIHIAPVEPSTWLKANKLLLSTATKPHAKESQVTPFSSLIRCGVCGSPMLITWNHRKKDGSVVFYYKCQGRKEYGKDYCNNKSIKQEILDNYVYNCLKENRINKITVTDNKKNIEVIKKKIEKNDKKINVLIDSMLEMEGDALSNIKIKIKELSNENEKLRNELLLLDGENESDSEIDLKTMYDAIMSTDINGKRRLLNTIIKKVTYNGNFDIEPIKVYTK